MKNYIVKTRAEFEQTYAIEAANEEMAKEIALSNVQNVLEQTQTSEGEVLSIEETS